jgi:excisionase family DNA binding protein
MTTRLLTVEEVADLLRVAPGTIRNMVSAKRIPVVKFSRRCLFDPREIERWIEANSQPERDLSSVLDRLGRRRRTPAGTP